MSDVVRNYTGSGGRISARPMQTRGGCLAPLGLVAALLFIFLIWLTWNSYDVEAFMPAGLRYGVVLSDPMNCKERIASSAVWNSWPDAPSRDAMLSYLRHDPGVPRWVLNNLVTQRLYLFGDDVREFSDAIAITHITRIGVVLEQLQRLNSGISSDYAGGLRLRRVNSSGLYYAIRGRVLIVSPKRDALIHALTLPSDAILDKASRDELTRDGAEDFRGTVQLAASDPLGDVFQSISVAVRIDQDRAYAKCHGIIRDSARSRFGPLLNGAKPYQLDEPIPGPIELSANFGKPVREVWASLGEALQSSWMNAAQWQAWEAT